MDKNKINARQLWASNRFSMETENLKSKRYGGKTHHHWYLFLFLLKFLKSLLKITGLYQRGINNGNNIVLTKRELVLKDLPESFDGFTIVQLSDLHIENHPDLEKKVIDLLKNESIDLCVFTGDYQVGLHGVMSTSIHSMEYLVKHIKSKYGFTGILGNHDSCHVVNSLEEIGIKMLINENQFIEKNGERIQLIGTDDVHYYFTDQSILALGSADKEFTIGLIHSPEIYDSAADAGVNLYLCGHTHAGQICLPGGIALIKHLNNGEKYYKGQWKYKEMQGVTSSGVGTSGLPIRFNTKGEVVHLTLRCQS
jgi:predicted MPP superfamily phosphohydrolase